MCKIPVSSVSIYVCPGVPAVFCYVEAISPPNKRPPLQYQLDATYIYIYILQCSVLLDIYGLQMRQGLYTGHQQTFRAYSVKCVSQKQGAVTSHGLKRSLQFAKLLYYTRD